MVVAIAVVLAAVVAAAFVVARFATDETSERTKALRRDTSPFGDP